MDCRQSSRYPNDRVQTWLDEIVQAHTHSRPSLPKRRFPTDDDSAASTDQQHHSTKRRCLLTPSPTSSPEEPMSSHLSKRSFDQASSASVSSASVADSYEDIDQTPTKHPKRFRPLEPFGRTPSLRSGYVSPKKLVRNVALSTARTRSYDATLVPDSLKEMWRGISEYDGGIGVIGNSERVSYGHEFPLLFPLSICVPHPLSYSSSQCADERLPTGSRQESHLRDTRVRRANYSGSCFRGACRPRSTDVSRPDSAGR